MIGRLRGEVIDKSADTIVVDVGGVGYVVSVVERAGHQIGDSADLHIHTHVREDALQLFGFVTPMDRQVFELLITVPSVGPVKAMGVLETPIEALLRLVADRDVTELKKLPGIGKRTAERMVVDLGDKFATLAAGTPSTRPTATGLAVASAAGMLVDLTSALINLGYKAGAGDRAAHTAIEELGAEAGFDPLLRRSLEQLRRR